MSRIHIYLSFVLFLAGSAAYAAAPPSVLVTVPALHSLVSGLMQGIAEPRLLLDDASANPGQPLTDTQLRMLANADMIVWAGPGLESGLKDAVDNRVPVVRNRLVTLSAMVPLLPNTVKGASDSSNYRNDARNLEFWGDPRLSIMAIRTLTPRLVRMDPDNTERYLDNEIALIKRLKGLEQEMVNTAVVMPAGMPGAPVADTNRYFLHRMEFPVMMATVKQQTGSVAAVGCHDRFFRKVADGSGTALPQTLPASLAVYGVDYYFEMMRTAMEKLIHRNCDASAARNPA